jgi:RNA polymerase sigma-70 factor (ECF subfamily)
VTLSSAGAIALDHKLARELKDWSAAIAPLLISVASIVLALATEWLLTGNTRPRRFVLARINLSQFSRGRRCSIVNAQSGTVDDMRAGEARFDFEATFRAQYERIARVIARVVRDPARAEELAVEVFLKLWRSPQAQSDKAEGWLYRTAIRKGLDELRRRTRRTHYERLPGFSGGVPTPEELSAATEEQQRVRLVLAAMDSCKAELLLLRSDGLSYEELASALELNVVSIGTLLRRAQESFRKEYVKRYGEE